jgi:hypothetical protein
MKLATLKLGDPSGGTSRFIPQTVPFDANTTILCRKSDGLGRNPDFSFIMP